MKLTKRQLLIFDELFFVIATTWFLFLLFEFIKPGLISNHYYLNIHFILVLVLFITRIVVTDD
ncbi:MAG: hypothetical protein ACKKL6_02150 [Candidatus Komeilibacteria bacterium]